MPVFDVIIIGAGAAGLMCAIEAGKRGRKVLILDHANKAGKKILMSGGGRCNFTNYSVAAENYLSRNPHFCKSALSRYTQWDFLALVNAHRIAYHERLHGQLFCDDSAKDILTMLLTECAAVGVTVQLDTRIDQLDQQDGTFRLSTAHGILTAQSLVIASGGLSIPKMGATPFGYKVAEQFGLAIVPTRAGLVPLTLQPQDKDLFAPLSGIAVPCSISAGQRQFKGNLLFTHRGLSGPCVLQISSYWQPGATLHINLLPEGDIADLLSTQKAQQSRLMLKTVLAEQLPKRLLSALIPEDLLITPVQALTHKQVQAISDQLHHWQLKPNATEGYRTAEVTIGGVDCNDISSKTLASLKHPNLYFIGEVLDVSGWLGGYNFQWAWSSGWCAGQYV
ncbi:MAG: NAD(P)/FAD-dependent oxidoreductase [Methylococcaceae bacterium]|nr:NAD(P)/FAD-dependent oxidoreductase [Methylococcaceae bacterium]